MPTLRVFGKLKDFATPGTWIAYVGVALRPSRAKRDRDDSTSLLRGHACPTDVLVDDSQLLFSAASPAALSTAMSRP
jgi:hypothetical protein